MDDQQFTLFQHDAVQEPTQAVVEAPPKVFKAVPMEKLKWREPIVSVVAKRFMELNTVVECRMVTGPASAYRK